MYHLVTLALDKITVFPLLTGSNRIGRGGANEIVISNPHVSREHAMIVVGEDQITINDLSSSHTTWVNGVPVTDQAELRPGDNIRLGDQEFVIDEDPVEAGEETPNDLTVYESGRVRFSAPDRVQSSARLDATDVRGEAIQSPTVTHAMMVALTDAGNLLTGNRPLSEIFDGVLDLVEQVIPARRILLLTTDSPTGELVVRGVRSARADGARLVLSQAIVATVLEERQALLLNDLPHDSRFVNSDSIAVQKLRSALVAPLFDNTDVIGLLYADDDRLFSTYDDDHLRAFTLLANLIAIKITNVRLHEAEQAMIRLEEELATASHVQRSMLPASFPDVAGYSMIAFNEPCEEVGGDLYDLERLDDGRLIVALGDVSGKGIGAALLMSNVLACLRVLYQECLDPRCLADRLHRELFESTEPGYFVTLFLAILDPVNHRLDYVNAGHNPPMLVCGDAEPLLLEATGLPLGLLSDAEYEANSVDFPPDSLLCVFSDGIPEAWTGTDFYGDERLVENLRTLRSLKLEEISKGVIRDVQAFLAGTAPSDDMTLCLLRREAKDGLSSSCLTRSS